MTAPATPATDRARDLLYGRDEEDLRAAVRDLLTDRGGPAAVLDGLAPPFRRDTALWETLARSIGAAGLLVPERFGGAGAGHREAAVVLEELGHGIAPVPYLTSAVIATSALLGCDVDGAPDTPGALAANLLRRLAEGAATAALAVPFTAAPGGAPTPVVRTGESGADGSAALTGTVGHVADAAGADLLLVPAHGPSGGGLYAVEAVADGVAIDPLTPLDLTRGLAVVRLDGASGRLVAGPDRAATAVEAALLAGAGLLASEQLGIAQWCLAETVRHTGERHQFGRPVGSFQALKHRMAALWLDVGSARATARNAADALAAGASDTAVAVAVAQAYCAPVAVHAAQECVQLHGGIGMTWEHPAHLYLKRAKSDESALGSPGRHRETLAGLVDLAAP